eukprot:CAMPEP_0113901806 /NCGR_PEP_ID=MMETSP0780_2-20120614/21464_1 /TAXON_ID=652834 /ORGANISM="Palpitomonas bilix" /LENGTH=554 /DNA_ID=CAMNT_0000894471 /DNA_START=23 /DNA_END=1687 /DNA_ORIENTATION=+ /assembly_acc=CAM_ASM_000599
MKRWGTLALVFVALALATADEPAAEDAPGYVSPEAPKSAIFFDNFDSGMGEVWHKSVIENDEEELMYAGEVGVEEPSSSVEEGNLGLVLKSAAKRHGVAATFSQEFKPEEGFVVQYEVKLQNGLECGGAYMKVLSFDKGFSGDQLAEKTPYTVMFGPDKCGGTNKVHFIFRHTNPKSGEVEEKHLTNPPQIKADKLRHLYTLIVREDNSFEILIDQKSVRTGSLLEDFDPAVNPPKMIDDPEDLKPEDWVDDEYIPDPEASKPEDWDEDAPEYIVDPDATKPADWLDDAPEVIDDPDAEKPDDWDDEEDGDWEAPKIANPDCASHGCGEWKAPKIKNPEYKGKWEHPMIKNPDYIGEWAPRQIENPHFFEDSEPHKMTSMGGVAFEIWTMQNGILFDNVLIATDEEEAKAFAAATFGVTSKLEKKNEAGSAIGAFFNDGITWYSEQYMQNPVVTIGATIGVIVLIVVVPCYFCLCRGGDEEETPAGEKEEEEEEETEEGEEGEADRAADKKGEKAEEKDQPKFTEIAEGEEGESETVKEKSGAGKRKGKKNKKE